MTTNVKIWSLAINNERENEWTYVMFYIQNKPFHLNNNIYIESSCSHCYCLPNPISNLYRGAPEFTSGRWEKVVSAHTHERTFKQTSNRAAFLFNITISTAATQNILIWTGPDLEHQNVILNVNVTTAAARYWLAGLSKLLTYKLWQLMRLSAWQMTPPQ